MANTTNDSIRELLTNGINAVLAAAGTGKKSAAKIQEAATNPTLKQELTRGTEVSETWRQRIEAAQKAVEGGGSGTSGGVISSISHAARAAVGVSDNRIVDAIYETGKQVTEHADSPEARDLGIITTGQIALHYYVAAFGSLASYASHLGFTDIAETMKRCADEAKQEDARHTDLARQIMEGAKS